MELSPEKFPTGGGTRAFPKSNSSALSSELFRNLDMGNYPTRPPPEPEQSTITLPVMAKTRTAKGSSTFRLGLLASPAPVPDLRHIVSVLPGPGLAAYQRRPRPNTAIWCRRRASILPTVRTSRSTRKTTIWPRTRVSMTMPRSSWPWPYRWVARIWQRRLNPWWLCQGHRQQYQAHKEAALVGHGQAV